MILQDAINTQVNKQTDCDLIKKVSCDIPRQNSNSDIFSRNNESETEKIKFSPSFLGVFIYTCTPENGTGRRVLLKRGTENGTEWKTE